MRNLFHCLAFIFLLTAVTPSHAQIDGDKLKLIYIFKIANQFEWPDSIKRFNIGYYGNSTEEFKTLQSYAKKGKIKGKTAVVSSVKFENLHKGCHLLFIDEEKSKELKAINDQLKNTQTLTFSSNVKEEGLTMINFYTSFDNKLRFFINDVRVREKKLQPSLLLTIMGGSQENILDLFEQKDSTLIREREQRRRLKKQFQSKETQLEKIKIQLDTTEKAFATKKEELGNKIAELHNLNQRLNAQRVYLDRIQKQITINNKKLEQKEFDISTKEKKLVDQKAKVTTQEALLTKQKKQIKRQKNILKEQEDLIKLKEENLNTLILFSTLLLITSVLTFVFFFGYRRKGRKLKQKNQELERILNDLQVAQSRLVQNEKMASLGMVTAGMAHEINNPMTFVYIGISVLKEEVYKLMNDSNVDDTRRENIIQTLKDIEFGSKRVTDIVDSLQNFSRLNERNKKKIHLKESINSTLTILGSHARKKDATINTSFDETLPKIEYFPASINQVLVNVLSNAIQAIPDKEGEINIITTQDDGFALIKIKDNGTGISKDIIDKIFDPFFTTKSPGNGTGLGLSISYNIIKKHNGSIEVESELGKGTEFTIKLPL